MLLNSHRNGQCALEVYCIQILRINNTPAVLRMARVNWQTHTQADQILFIRLIAT